MDTEKYAKPQKLDKKTFIKKSLINMVALIAFVLVLIFIVYGGAIPVRATLIAIGMLIVIILITTLFYFKYPNIRAAKIRKAFLIVGILTVIVNLALIIIKGGKIDYYLGVILGLYFIYYSRVYKIKNHETSI